MTPEAHDVKNALTALRLQSEVTAEVIGGDAMAPVLRLVDRVEAAIDALLAQDSTDG